MSFHPVTLGRPNKELNPIRGQRVRYERRLRLRLIRSVRRSCLGVLDNEESTMLFTLVTVTLPKTPSPLPCYSPV
jgi:hypothetical protein